MSRTEMKNGASVEAAAKSVAFNKVYPWYGHFTVGEVARYAGCSKPTAQKYIRMLVAAGTVKEMPRDMRYCLKTTPLSFVWMAQ